MEQLAFGEGVDVTTDSITSGYNVLKLCTHLSECIAAMLQGLVEVTVGVPGLEDQLE